MPKALVRKMHRLGVSPAKWLTVSPKFLDDYHDLERRLEAKTARVEWQSSGIRMLHDEIATLEARLAMLPAMQDTEVKQRITQLEADLALREAIEGMDSILREGELT